MTRATVAADDACERFVLEFQVAGGSWQREPLSSCLGTRFEKGLRNFAGWWYFATTGAHVGFESWLERDHLMLMDFDPGVEAVSSLFRSTSAASPGPAGKLVSQEWL